jgi:hypothetical protein
MLFDLRGRHRRRAVRVIYSGLAVLIGIGLIGFGIGGGFGGGGLLNAASENTGSGGASFSNQIKKYEKTTRVQPANVAAWEKLTLAILHESGGEAYVNASTGTPTPKGKELLGRAARSWERYLALSPSKPNVELAKLMAQRVYTTEGLNQPSSAVQALQIVVAAEPTSVSWYSQLAAYAYKAKNTRVGDLAAAKAVSLAPASERKRLEQDLASVKKSPEGETLTTKKNGTTFTGKENGSGEVVATAVNPTTPPPAKTSTSKTK